MKMEYKTTFWNHLKALELLLIVIAGIICFVWYQTNHNNFDVSLRDGSIVFGLFNILPVLYLHIEYYSYNQSVKLEIDSWAKKVTYTDKTGIIQAYNFDELSKIVIYMPPCWHSKRIFIRIPFDQYHYARIYTKSGKKIIITCLMVQRVQDAVGSIRGVPIEKKKRLFASILLEDLWN